MYILATDLDRTLLPNGNQEYDGSMEIFSRIVEEKELKLVYVTGRHLRLVMEAMEEFHAPEPEYIIAEVGTRIYGKGKNGFIEDKEWTELIVSRTKNWNVDIFKKELSSVQGLRMQEEDKQNQFKLSYYVDDIKNSGPVVKKATGIVKKLYSNASILYSVDEKNGIGLLDVLPKYATKLTALEYLRTKLNFKKEEVIYCGDSGNDLLPLTFGYRCILVRNSLEELKNAVKNSLSRQGIPDRLYIAKGTQKLNGYYVSGIIEGLIEFGIIPPEFIE